MPFQNPSQTTGQQYAAQVGGRVPSRRPGHRGRAGGGYTPGGAPGYRPGAGRKQGRQSPVPIPSVAAYPPAQAYQPYEAPMRTTIPGTYRGRQPQNMRGVGLARISRQV